MPIRLVASRTPALHSRIPYERRAQRFRDRLQLRLLIGMLRAAGELALRRKRSPDTEAVAANPDLRVERGAIGRAEVDRVFEPGAAAKDTKVAISGPSAPIGWSALIVLVIAVLDPLQDVAVHVIKAEGVGTPPRVLPSCAAGPKPATVVFGLLACCDPRQSASPPARSAMKVPNYPPAAPILAFLGLLPAP